MRGWWTPRRFVVCFSCWPCIIHLFPQTTLKPVFLYDESGVQFDVLVILAWCMPGFVWLFGNSNSWAAFVGLRPCFTSNSLGYLTSCCRNGLLFTRWILGLVGCLMRFLLLQRKKVVLIQLSQILLISALIDRGTQWSVEFASPLTTKFDFLSIHTYQHSLISLVS